jgi:hypothetical protein
LKIAWKHPVEVFYQLYKQERDARIAKRWQAPVDVETRGAIEASEGAGGRGACDDSVVGEVV